MCQTNSSKRGEEGASLIIALVFVLLISLILLAIVNLSGTNIVNTTNLQNERSLEYAAEGQVETAIQAVRYLAPAATSSYCPQSANAPNASHSYEPAAGGGINGADVDVYCQAGILTYERSVSFEACPHTTSPSDCVGNTGDVDVIQAMVLISDVAGTCSSGTGPGCYNPVGSGAGSTSGSSITIEHWIASRANG